MFCRIVAGWGCLYLGIRFFVQDFIIETVGFLLTFR